MSEKAAWYWPRRVEAESALRLRRRSESASASSRKENTSISGEETWARESPHSITEEEFEEEEGSLAERNRRVWGLHQKKKLLMTEL